MDAAVELHEVTVRYRVPHRRIPTFKEWAIELLTARLRYDDFHALRGISLAVPTGESLGIVGANGAGKSTLLRVAAGILTPSEGEAVVRGRIAPIIELGTGFDEELTGRENVFFNGALLGRSRAEMEGSLPDIIDFAGLGDFMEAPLRTYSTGMVARLAFAVATAVEADVLLLDEILSVGDEAFRLRCRDRIDDFLAGGATVLLVSHDLAAVEDLCARAIWLHEGEVVAAGKAREVVDRYREWMRSGASGDGRGPIAEVP